MEGRTVAHKTQMVSSRVACAETAFIVLPGIKLHDKRIENTPIANPATVGSKGGSAGRAQYKGQSVCSGINRSKIKFGVKGKVLG
jgi:hypothetical protein